MRNLNCHCIYHCYFTVINVYLIYLLLLVLKCIHAQYSVFHCPFSFLLSNIVKH